MATSTVQLANQALIELGERRITSFLDNSTQARLVNEVYDHVRQRVLRDHYWNCAINRAVLNQLSEQPAWGYGYAFQLPSDFLRLVRVEDHRLTDFKVEGRKILTHRGDMSIVYVFDLKDVVAMDMGLQDAIVARLVHALAMPLTGDAARKSQALVEYEDRINKAKYEDANEGRIEVLTNQEWVDAHGKPGWIQRGGYHG